VCVLVRSTLRSNGFEYCPVPRFEKRDESVDKELADTVLAISTTFAFVLKGLKAPPKLLSVLLATLAALCKGVKGGLLGLCLGSVASSGGVKNGSSGGCCCTMDSVATDGYDLNDGVWVTRATRSREDAGSIVISGIDCRELDCELAREREAAVKKAASAERCFLRKLPASEDSLGVVGLDRSGFVTRSWPGGTESLYPSPQPWAYGRGQCCNDMRMIWWSSSTVTRGGACAS